MEERVKMKRSIKRSRGGKKKRRRKKRNKNIRIIGKRFSLSLSKKTDKLCNILHVVSF